MKGKVLAIVSMLAVSAFAGELLDVGQWQLQPALVGLIAAGLGGFIAKTRFVAASLLVHAFVWLAILYMLHSIAHGQSTYLAIAKYNALAMVISFPAVGFGAYLGQWLAGRRRPSAPAAA